MSSARSRAGARRALGARRPRRRAAPCGALRAHGRARHRGRRRPPRGHPARRGRCRPDGRAEEFVELVGKPPRPRSSRSTRCATRTTPARPTSAARSSSCSRAARCSCTSTRAAPRSRCRPRFRADASLVLRFGYTLQPAIGDLVVDDEGIAGTLTFGGQPFHVRTAVDRGLRRDGRGRAARHRVARGRARGRAHRRPATSPRPPRSRTAEALEAAPRAKRDSHLKLVE